MSLLAFHLAESLRMDDKVKIIKREDKPVHPDLARLVKSMQTLLRRRYPDAMERQLVVGKIMFEVQKVA